jgi:hypothetical protein
MNIRSKLAGAAVAAIIALATLPTVEAQQAATSSAVGADELPPAQGYVPVPGGWAHESCGTTIPDGAEVSDDSDGSTTVRLNGRTIRSMPPCHHPFVARRRDVGRSNASQSPPPAVGNWLAYTYMKSIGTGPFNGLGGQWTVPPAPAKNGAVIYFFNGLEDSDTAPTVIIQPVLHWGNSPAAADNANPNRWYMANWRVNFSGNWGVGTLTPVAVGATITGTLQTYVSTCSSNCSWYLTITDGTTTSHFITIALPAMRLAFYSALEAYFVTSCDRLPNNGGLVFSNIYATQPMLGEVAAANTWTDFSTTPAGYAACGYAAGHVEAWRMAAVNY